MKAFGWIALIALLGLIWSAAPARADDPAVHKELQDIYNQVADGLKKKDPDAAKTYIADDFVERDGFGKRHTRAEVAEAMRKALEDTLSVNDIKMDVQRVVVRGDFAVALVNRHVATTIKDPKGNGRPFTSDVVALDVWQKTADGWRLRRSHGVSVQQTLDGKPMKPGTRRYATSRRGSRRRATPRRTTRPTAPGH